MSFEHLGNYPWNTSEYPRVFKVSHTNTSRKSANIPSMNTATEFEKNNEYSRIPMNTKFNKHYVSQIQ